MKIRTALPLLLTLALVTVLWLVPAALLAHEPAFTEDLGRERCTFTTSGTNPYFPLWPGYSLHLAGEEEDDGEMVEIEVWINILADTELVDGVVTRVVEEVEMEDGELVEISRNFLAYCRETGDIFYFGEDVDDYEDGEIVGHGGAWRAGVDGAEPGILHLGTPLLGARYFNEIAPGVALDQAEVVSLDTTLTVPAGTFTDVLKIDETSPLDLGIVSEKWYAPGVGTVKDDAVELVEVNAPPCQPDANTLCLNDGRFQVVVDFVNPNNGEEGFGHATPVSDDSGEIWFFGADNVELLVKVLDACDLPGFNSYWVFVAGLTNVELTVEVTDTQAGVTHEYDNDPGSPFAPVLDTAAFMTCP